ncbi:MAG: hypothetical protein KDC76_13440, partial [Bacteroidetes bacterium]|nr:hypothetical protein [Bacteroidota bacterium]
MKTSRMMRGLILSVAFITLLIQGSVLQAQTSCCTGKNKPVKIEFTYTGESCSATSSHQDSDKYGCSGDPQDDQSVYIVAANKSYLPSALIWFSGTVSIDSSFVIDAANAGESRLKGETYIQVFDQQNGTKLQEVYFHTSCSQPLIAGDQYGSIYLKGILLENGNTCGTFEDDEDPNESCCVDGFKPADISLIYTGESCSATNTTQASDKFNCYGNPNSASSVYIIANNNNDPTQGDKWFEGSVQLDSVFTIHASLSGATKLSSNTVIHIFASQGGTLLQRVNFHTSCSQPLSIGDQWGSVQLYGMRGEQGGTCGTVDDVDDSNESCCVDGFKPAQLSLQYTGEDCSGTSTSQSSDKYNCSGDPNDANAVYVIANNDDNASNGDRWFEGWVLLDSTFTLDASNAGATKLSSNTVIHIFDHEGGSLLQKVNFHTSCSQPLDLDDQWGALKLVGMVGEDGSTCGNPSTNPEPICNRELINTTSCVGRKFVLYMIDTTGKAYWLEGDSTSYSWTEFSNGTVLVKGENFTHADLSSESFDFEVLLSGATSTAPSGSPKYNYCGAISSFANWVYFQHVSGVVTSSTRGVFTLSLRGPAFQQGMDANTNQLGYGASGWFHMEGGDGFFDKGDINAMLSTECSTIKEPESCCVDGFKPKQISLTYTGEGCSATQTTQSSDKYGCYGDPSGRDVVYIVANNDNNPSNGDRWFEGWVLLDSVFTIDANFADKDYLSSNTVVHIFDFPGGSVLQRVNFHTSCSQPLITGDQWGAVQLEGMVSKYGDTCGTPHSNPEPTCERELKNTTSCVGRKFVLYLIDSTGTAFWLEGDSTSYHWQEYNNGMVHLTGEGFTHASLSGDEFAYDIWLLNATSTAPSGSPKSNYCGTISSYSDWTYFNSLVGTVTSDNHGTFSLSRRGPAFQQGTDANTNQLGYGASGWFYLHGGDGYFTDGDINAMLSETCQEDEVITSCCVDGYKPQQVTLTYTGESCSATSTTQDSDKYNCTGDPDGRDLVYIIANDKNNPADGKIWFTGWVIKDSSFTLNALELGEDYLKSNTVIHVYDQPNGSLLQRVNFHTSCSQPLNIGDQWGAIKLRGMISEEGASCGYPSDNPVPVCDRELKNTTSCVGRKFVLYMIDTTGTSYWLEGDSTSYSWEEYSNSTVVLTGSGFTHTAFSGEEFSYHIVLTEATTTPPASSPKTNYCGTISDMSDWVYFKSMVGTVTSSERGVFTLSRRGPAFQQGTDANTNQLGYGASGWFFMEGGDGFF